jgi:hypothetical protein
MKATASIDRINRPNQVNTTKSADLKRIGTDEPFSFADDQRWESNEAQIALPADGGAQSLPNPSPP